MNIINVKQLRENFGKVKEEIGKGNSFLLLYRSYPLAEIRPVQKMHKADLSQKNKLKANISKIQKLAGGLKLRHKLLPEELNRIYDKSYHDKSYYEMLP